MESLGAQVLRFLVGWRGCAGLERRLFLWVQPAPVTGCQRAQLHWSDANAHQIFHAMTQELSGAADLAVAALLHGELQEGALRVALQHAQLHAAAGVAIEGNPGAPALQGVVCGAAADPDPIALAVVVAGVGERQGEGAVIAEQQGSAAVGVKAPHGMQPRAVGQLRWQEIQHRAPAAGVVAGAVHPAGFVQQQGEQPLPLRQWAAIHKDLILGRISLVTRLSGLAIELHPSLAHQLFCPPPGAQPRLGQKFLQPFAAHGLVQGSESCISAPPPW